MNPLNRFLVFCSLSGLITWSALNALNEKKLERTDAPSVASVSNFVPEVELEEADGVVLPSSSGSVNAGTVSVPFPLEEHSTAIVAAADGERVSAIESALVEAISLERPLNPSSVARLVGLASDLPLPDVSLRLLAEMLVNAGKSEALIYAGSSFDEAAIRLPIVEGIGRSVAHGDPTLFQSLRQRLTETGFSPTEIAVLNRAVARELVVRESLSGPVPNRIVFEEQVGPELRKLEVLADPVRLLQRIKAHPSSIQDEETKMLAKTAIDALGVDHPVVQNMAK